MSTVRGGQGTMDSVATKKRAILGPVLSCPSCHGHLDEEQEQYACAACGTNYPVHNGIPRFASKLSGGENQIRRSFNHQHLKYLDSSFLHFGPDLIEQWLRDIQLPGDFFRDKLVLDAGCGSGRWTYAMASLGARVVAVDLTEAGVDITGRATAHLENVATLQASIFDLPFQPQSFDLVVSWGVLHHTPNTKAAFERVAPLVRRGGQLYVMVYERHNPVKFLCTDVIRWLLRWLPEDRRYRACKLLLIKNRLLYSALTRLIICTPYPASDDPLDVSTRQLGLYDAYSPMFNHLHTWQEVFAWFHEQDFDDVMLTKPVRYTSRLDILQQGECGGSVNVRGTRT